MGRRVSFKVIARDDAQPYVHPVTYGLAATQRTGRIIGKNDRAFVIDIRRNVTRFCVIEEDWREQGERTLRWLQQPQNAWRLDREQRRSAKSLRRFCRRLTQLSTRSSSELIALYRELLARFVEMNSWGHVANLTDFSHNLLTQRCQQILNHRLQATGSRIPLAEVMGVLLTPLERSPVQHHDADLWRLFATMRRAKLLPALKHPADDALVEIKRVPRAWHELQRHIRTYRWMQFHYYGPVVLGAPYFLELLRGLAAIKLDPVRELRKVKVDERRLAKQQRTLVRTLKLSREERYWMTLARTLVFLKALRKDTAFQASRDSDPLIRELARRLGMSPTQVRHLTDSEVARALHSHRAPTRVANDRIAFCVVSVQGKSVRLLTGRAGLRLASQITEDRVDRSVRELRGDPAYPGKVRGVVKLVMRAEDMPKVHRGDVLVAPATNPNVLPAMKLAAAFVTDEGGVTCHAAIVSREMKKPCVIGTKVATQVLHDGERVEVDAIEGIVRRIR